MLIGFGHRKGTGKSTCARLLAAEHGFAHLAFTEPLRAAMRLTNPIVTKDPATGHAIRWAEMEERLGYDQAKAQCPEFRDSMIRTGNGLRVVIDDWVWIRPVMASARLVRDAVIDCVRYPTEVEAIRAAGGVLVKVVRPDVPDTHDAADDALDGYEGWDATIVNDGTVADLHTRLREALSLGVSCAG